MNQYQSEPLLTDAIKESALVYLAMYSELSSSYAEAEATLGTGCGLEPLHWPELADGDSRYINWRRAAGLGAAT